MTDDDKEGFEPEAIPEVAGNQTDAEMTANGWPNSRIEELMPWVRQA